MSSEPQDNPANPFSRIFENGVEIVDANLSETDSIVQLHPGSETVGHHNTELAEPVTDEFGRLHPSSLLFDIISHVRALIIPAIIAALSAASGSGVGAVIAGVVFVPALSWSVIRFFTLRYRIRNRELVVTEGIFFRRIRTVPVARIQNIDLVQNVLHRLLGVAEVRVETASGTEPEAKLRVLGLREVEALRDGIFASRAKSAEIGSTESASSPLAAPSSRETLLTIPTGMLVRAGLASNRGMLLLGVLAGAWFQFDEQIERVLDVGNFARQLSENSTATGFYLELAAGIIVVLVLFRLLGTVWYLLRFYGYQLTRSGDELRIQCGLLTKVSATVPRQRIQFISIHRNLIMRWMKLATIRIETAGAAGKGSEDAAKSMSSRWFVPVLPDAKVPDLLRQLRPGLDWNIDHFDWKPISPRAAARMSRQAVLGSIVVAAAGFAITRPWGWAFGIAVLPLFVWIAVKKANSKRYARNDDCVVYRSGIFTKKTSVTFFEKIQTLRIDETPFDRRWKMASLCIDTAAAGPADHQIHIAYLTREFANSEFAAIAKKSARHQPVFG